uniref:C-type lectin domain-containing protein n=1 Tax=Neogobius melanostomus TaxID=47308 RepID=A0A8C6SUV6_9GOBI
MAANGPLIVFLCLTGALLTPGAVARPPYREFDCPGDWSLFGTRCFRFFEAEKTWTMAEKRCNKLGGNLASIHTDWENVFIRGLINGNAWLGGHDMDQDGVWMWTDGSPWDYRNWADGEPNNLGGNEDSLEIYAHGPADTFWNDNLSSREMSYICAKDAFLIYDRPDPITITW